MPDYVVKQGDCINSIAFQFGFFPETIWNHSKNASLKNLRKNPSILYEGDKVFIPEKGQKTESINCDSRNRFKMKGVPAKLHVKVLWMENMPRANVKYRLEIGDKKYFGTTNENGEVQQSIPPNIVSCKLFVGEDEEEYDIKLGYIDPIDKITGIQGRLNNLGYDFDLGNSEKDPRLKSVLKEFQTNQNIEITGEADEATRKKLMDISGC
jgi:hypothetical protein